MGWTGSPASNSSSSVTTSSASATSTSPSLYGNDQSSDSSGGSGTSPGAATYYGAVALAISILLGATIFSRVIYIRRLRRSLIAQRLENSRRGEANGLPTYVETTSNLPAYFPSFGAGRSHAPAPTESTFIPLDHPSYTPSHLRRPNRTYHPADTLAPPAYVPPPPKYEGEEAEGAEGGLGSREAVTGQREEEGAQVHGGTTVAAPTTTTLSDREPELGGAGQEIEMEFVPPRRPT